MRRELVDVELELWLFPVLWCGPFRSRYRGYRVWRSLRNRAKFFGEDLCDGEQYSFDEDNDDCS